MKSQWVCLTKFISRWNRHIWSNQMDEIADALERIHHRCVSPSISHCVLRLQPLPIWHNRSFLSDGLEREIWKDQASLDGKIDLNKKYNENESVAISWPAPAELLFPPSGGRRAVPPSLSPRTSPQAGNSQPSSFSFPRHPSPACHPYLTGRNLHGLTLSSKKGFWRNKNIKT